MGNILENNGCGGITGNFVTGQAKARTILHEWVGQQSEYHSVYFIKVLSSLKKTPCELDPPQNADTECFLIRSGVTDPDGNVYDWYLENCPHGPPCLLLASI
jgi:hypothetical protein